MANFWRISCIVVLVLFASCSVQKRAIKRVKWVDERSPITLVRWCASNVPVRADTIVIPGEEIVIPGTVIQVDCDTITEVEYKDRIVSVPCPPSTHKTDTFRVTAIDSAQVVLARHVSDSLRYQLILKEQDLSRSAGAKNTWMWVAISLGGVTLIMGVIFGLSLKSKIGI